ncbi:hypothetical protein [Lactiplantibacillus mudanjiangensis]|uniref:Uncharacterized protein n=1 Tax=Lactiplantibacillus mudanjiangensis TaxID=1296538 RepID=A0A660E3C8_9LACO|nr:hypothetical protein [Lactiplantibacillus mudanjiangensis]VDG24097.1 hypothetical protein [Lactobacillus paraplantarum] [Lactiplantibacillus mudanjiangensis]VDG30274.1 hypothetical protein [Lactobacillus paraplantarum] [Lactiplantibacillus mudanjiangensis]
MSPNDLVLYLQRIQVLPTQDFWWQPFGRTAIEVDIDGKRQVYQLDLAQQSLKVFQASSQTEMSGDFHLQQQFTLTKAQLAVLPQPAAALG